MFAWLFTLVLMLLNNSKHIAKTTTEKLYRFTRVLGPIVSMSSFIMTFYNDLSNWWMWVLAFFAAMLIAALCLRLQQRVKTWLETRYPDAPSPPTTTEEKDRSNRPRQPSEGGTASGRETTSSSSEIDTPTRPLLVQDTKL